MSDFGFAVCEQLAAGSVDPDLPFIYLPKFREFGVKYCDGGSAFQTIEYCPFCGELLPESLRDKWFDEIDELGLDPQGELPPAYLGDDWWRHRSAGDTRL